MPEKLKEVSAAQIQDEIGKFSRHALGYEWPADPKEPRPREDLEWVRQQRKWSEMRQKMVGVFLVGLIGATASALATSLWPQIIAWLRGH